MAVISRCLFGFKIIKVDINEHKKVSQLLIGSFGSRLPSMSNKCRKPTLIRERFALFGKHRNSNCREMNESSNKANAFIYVCRLSVVLCHRRVVDFYSVTNSISVVSWRMPPSFNSGVLRRMSQSITNTFPLTDLITFSSCKSLR